jgi:hypothetical protein
MTYVPRSLRRSEGASAGLLVGAPVAAATSWSEFALGANWTRSKGACLVPHFSPTITIGAGTTRTFHFRVKTRNVAVSRIWGFLFRRASVTTATTATVRAPASTGAAVAYTVPNTRDLLVPVIYIEPVASKATATVDLTFDIAAAGGDLELEGISCYEQDRAGLLNDTTDFGVMIDTVRSGEPIAAIENQSAYGVFRSLANLDARRSGLYHWSYPAESPITRTTNSYLAVLELGVPVQTQKLNTSATTAAVKWSAYAKVAAGSGKVRLRTSASSVSSEITVTGTSFAWQTAADISINCDDFAEDDGRQAGTWDELNWDLQGDGTNALSVAAVSVWVDSAD